MYQVEKKKNNKKKEEDANPLFVSRSQGCWCLLIEKQPAQERYLYILGLINHLSAARVSFSSLLVSYASVQTY